MLPSQDFLSAVPMAFLLVLPIFFYYCVRTLCEGDQPPKYSSIPEYLMKQHVDKNRTPRRAVRPHHRSPHSSKSPYFSRSSFAIQKPRETLPTCSIGLTEYQEINCRVSPSRTSLSRIDKAKRKDVNWQHRSFCATALTTIYEDVHY